MPFHRVEHTTGFAMYKNECATDLRVSWQSRGFFVMVLHLPDDWKFSVTGLMTVFDMTKYAVESCVKELEKYGYIVRVKKRDEEGKWVCKEWHIYEEPTLEKPTTEKPTTEKPTTEKPTTVNQSLQSKKLYKERNIQNTHSDKGRIKPDDDHDNEGGSLDYIVKTKEEKKEGPTLENQSSVPPGGDEEKRPYGRYGKVSLTPREYETLKRVYADIDATIEDYTITKTLYGKQCDSDFKELLRKAAGGKNG